MTGSMEARHLRMIHISLAILIAGLLISGITAFPLESELRWLASALDASPLSGLSRSTYLLPWLQHVLAALTATNARYPFLAYGTDWLASAHLVLAMAFIGPYRDPVRNRWLITFGLLACTGVIPLALIAGQVRGIPFGWWLIDCSFGIFGSIPLLICRRAIDAMEREAGAP
jgi:hypothetical protein